MKETLFKEKRLTFRALEKMDPSQDDCGADMSVMFERLRTRDFTVGTNTAETRQDVSKALKQNGDDKQEKGYRKVYPPQFARF